MSEADSDSEARPLLSDSHSDAPKDATPGAPTERVNPLGHEVTLLSAVMLNLGQLMGSGMYSVPGSVLTSVGSVGLLLLFWLVSASFAFAGLPVYVELASMFPTRSGTEVVYLEQAYPKPRFLVPIMYAFSAVLLSFNATNAIVFAQYFLIIWDIEVTPHSQTVTAIWVTVVALAVVAVSTKWTLRIVNILSFLKVLSAIFMAALGLAVLAGLTRIEDPYANFHNIFEGSSSSLNSLAMGLVKTNYAYIGWQNAFNVLGEVRGKDPVRTIKRAGFISLTIMTVIYVLVNLAYVAAIEKNDIRNSGQLVAALFFQRVCAGQPWAEKALPGIVALSTFGNIIAVTAGRSRIYREIARQGLLPFPNFFAYTKPFGTPLGPILLMWVLTAIVIVALPSGDVFNFIVDLESYPKLIFGFAVVIGLWILRGRGAIPTAGHRAKNSTVVYFLISVIFLLVMPWIPPEPGHSDVSFWYATYCVAGLGVLVICAIYHYVWIIWLPRLGGYTIVEEVQNLPDGARVTSLRRKYLVEDDENDEPSSGSS